MPLWPPGANLEVPEDPKIPKYCRCAVVPAVAPYPGKKMQKELIPNAKRVPNSSITF